MLWGNFKLVSSFTNREFWTKLVFLFIQVATMALKL